MKFETFLCGSSRPFIARDESGQRWVLKACVDGGATKSLFNEYVAGKLANAIDLPWPTVRIAELAPAIIDQLKQAAYSVQSRWAVALNYVEGITPFEIGWVTKTHFPTPTSRSPFYGKCLFDNWLLLQDVKADTLQIRTDGKPMFLDASMAFGGIEWQKECLVWIPHRFNADAVYFDNIVSDINEFGPWLGKVESLTVSFLSRTFSSLPSDWPLDLSFVEATLNFLGNTQHEFLPKFRDSLPWIVNPK